MRLCLDTSAYSNFMRGSAEVVDVVDGASWIGVPVVVLGELRTGFAQGNKTRANERELSVFLRHPVVEVLELGDVVSRIYAEIVVALRASGTPLPTNDIWIAATAASAGATVVTYDQHFRAIARVGSLVF